jgi:hypothetical protein
MGELLFNPAAPEFTTPGMISDVPVSAGSQPVKGRPFGPVNDFIQHTFYAPSSPPEVNKPDGPHGIPQHQDSLGSWTKVTASTNLAAPALQGLQHGSALPSRSQSTVGAVNSPSDSNGGLDQRPQAAHTHYRQNSKAQGIYQHSRNTSYVNSPATSPLGPQSVGSHSVNTVTSPEFSSLTIVNRGTPNRRPTDSLSSTLIGSPTNSSTSTLGGDREQGDGSATMLAQKKLDRGLSVKGRRGHGHHRSHSKQQLLQEPTTVGEYALQHLFDAVGNPIAFCMT